MNLSIGNMIEMRKALGIVCMAVAAVWTCSCNKAEVAEVLGNEVCFSTGSGSVIVSADAFSTKAVPAGSITSFKCGATTGSAGSENGSSWNNIAFTTDGAGTYMASPKKYWPVSDPHYNFYAVAATSGESAATAAAAPDLTYATSGTTITMAAGYDKDVICAYEPTADVTWNDKNELVFDHIFARVSTVKVTAVAPCAISNVTVNIVNPKTGGTYNLRTGHEQVNGTGWSSLVPASGSQQVYRNTGSIASGSNHTGSDNNFFIVPGEYYLSCTWTARVDDYTRTYSNVTSTSPIFIEGGKVNVIECNLGGNPTEIVFGVSLYDWESYAITGVEFEHSEPSTPSTFGGLMIAPAPLYYSSANGFEIKDDDWNHDSYNSVYGKVDGSYYFNFVELGSYFDADGSSFSSSSGDIDNTNKISYGGYNDWRVPTYAEWCTITTGASPGTSREGSTVNGNAGAKYAIIQLTGVTHAGGTTPVGLLIFPDGKTFTGKELNGINNTTCTTGVTGAELNYYLNNGCVFLPSPGRYNGSWGVGSSYGMYWSATQRNTGRSYNLTFSSNNIITSNYSSKTTYYFAVWLVRNAE